MTNTPNNLLNAGTVDELRLRGCTVITGAGHTIAVFAKDDTFAAVDNRCPHMGFPLDRGTVKNGILTCHWHHARFDLASGGTFDPFADDVRAFPVSIIDNTVYVDPNPPEQDPVRRWSKRLQEGMEDNIRLVIAKSVLGLNSSPADYRTPLTIGATFGTTYSNEGWGPALSMLTSTANFLHLLRPEDQPRALYQGLRQVAAECAGRPLGSSSNHSRPAKPDRKSSNNGSATSSKSETPTAPNVSSELQSNSVCHGAIFTT